MAIPGPLSSAMSAMSASFTVPGAPVHELTRSPAATRVGQMASESGLFLAHYEHRVHLPLPEQWLPPGRADLVETSRWEGGVLPEPKYQCFRHDLLVGSFHPGHRAKWTAHELCHGLVGFAWRPGASRLFLALAARLAEVLPVALWYYFDEANLRRCTDHSGDGPLYGRYCAPCEDAARQGALSDDEEAERWWAEGRRFVRRELELVTRSARTGQPVSHRLGSLDLSSDGLAYAAAHSLRLESREFHRFAEWFFLPDQGLHDSLESLEARVLEVLDGIVDGGQVTPLAGGRWRWVAQDIGWRLLQVAAETGGEARQALLDLTERLAGEVNEQGVSQAQSTYQALAEEWVLPTPEDLFALGYDLPGGLGRSASQVAEGIASACPRAWDTAGPEVADHFLSEDLPVRDGIGRRFARFAREHLARACSDLATFEAALSHPESADADGAHLAPSEARGDLWLVPRGVELLEMHHDVSGEGPCVSLDTPVHLAVWRGGDGDVHVAELAADVWEALVGLKTATGHPPPCLEPHLEELAELRLVRPAAWQC